ncbi:MAG TPA: DEAD/DEAH box helicase [archaeon]|nr:DEAD/DEAH box helicase [archaeon]
MTTKIIDVVIKANSYNNLNPVQEKASKHLGENLLVCAPTASGKTTIFEMFLVYFATKKKKIIYISPLKALTFEHYNDIKKKYKELNLKIGISTGDLDNSSKNLSNYDVLFLTFEKFDSVIRHEPEWLKEIGMVCVDEIHELGSDRGTTLEVLITQLKVNYPSIVFLGLSATIGNADSLSSWLGAKLVKSNYRPIPLDIGISYQNTIYFDSGKKEIEDIGKEEYLASLINDTLKINKQVIVFCNSRNNTMNFSSKFKGIVKKYLSSKEQEELRNKAKEIGSALETPTKQCLSLYSSVIEGCAFHHAGLVYKQREIIEEEFKKGNLKVIFATPTLAAGINLPAYRVIITTVYRFSNGSMVLIPVNEFHQMSGRAGRPKYDSKGEAVVMVNKEGDIQRVYNSFVNAQATDIESQLSKINNLRTQLLSIILINNIKTIKELQKYMSKTFYFFVFGNDEAIRENITEIVNEFKDFGFIKKEKDNIELTTLGKKVCLLYIDPLSANNIINDINIKDNKQITMLEKLFTLCNTSECHPYLTIKKDKEEKLFETFEKIKENVFFDYEDLNLIEKVGLSELFCDWLDEMPEDKIVEKHNTTPGQLQDFVNKAIWINHCVLELIKVNKNNFKLYKEYLDLETQLKYGVRKELLPLVELKNIGRVRARKLFDNGITGVSDIKKEPDKFISIVGRIGLETLKELKIEYSENHKIAEQKKNIKTQTNIFDY